MKRYDRRTPASTRDLLFGECEELRRVQAQLCTLYEGQGYREVMTPSLEFEDVFEHSHGQVPMERTVRVSDAQNRMLCLRPDCTIPIARLVATKLRQAPHPLRLYYNTQVYATPREHAGKAAEFAQVGVELIGGDTREGDFEILRLALESLRCAGGECRLEICHIGFFQALFDELDAPEDVKAQVRELIEQKSYVTLGDLLARYDQPAAKALAVLPRLFGWADLFEKAREYVRSGAAREALDGLEALYRRLQDAGLAENVVIDLGLCNQPDYYTGVIFRGFAGGTGEPVLSGGRYDRLIGRFGQETPAVGFGVNASLVADSRVRGGEADDGGVTIALTKGRLEKHTVELFERLGYDCSALHEKGRRLILPLGDSGIRVILAKAADVLTYVEKGVADIGVVGKDTILENGGSFYEVLDLGFGKCRFALACKEGYDIYAGYSAKVIASKYPKVALDFFQNKGLDVDIVKIEGSVELAPLVGLADGIVDIVETGSTLRENGLRVVEEIAPVSARMIVNTVSMKMKRRRVGEIIEKVEGTLCRE